jgi:hypothetical protein
MAPSAMGCLEAIAVTLPLTATGLELLSINDHRRPRPRRSRATPVMNRQTHRRLRGGMPILMLTAADRLDDKPRVRLKR